MHEFSIWGIFVSSILFAVLTATIVWVCTDRPCNCYRVVALGMMGGTVGTIQGLILLSLLAGNQVTETESIIPVFLLSALFAAILQFRYATDV
ncbi:hypothetical protein H8K55_09105 [Undibacterium sp. LX15W]|uniref:Uncharacterized protein n=1 Tax=Undibacterium flavidum TaxID=2762297 RepID=A0ABR6YAT2_9BURK|nr:hypothetical protein [Undibacterium flavidum]